MGERSSGAARTPLGAEVRVPRRSATYAVPSAEVGGVRCEGCYNRVCEALASVQGVGRVTCDAASGSVNVDFDDEQISETEVAEELSRFGFELSSRVQHAAWRVIGLD